MSKPSFVINVIAVIIAAFLVISILLGFIWLFWEAWCYVLPKIYPTGNSYITHPNFALFVIAWLLLGAIGRQFTGK